MKIIKKEDINKTLYIDRAEEHPACNQHGEEYTCRTWLMWAIDVVPRDQKLTRKTIETMDKIYKALNQSDSDVSFEDADFAYLKEHIESLGVQSAHVYRTITNLLDIK